MAATTMRERLASFWASPEAAPEPTPIAAVIGASIPSSQVPLLRLLNTAAAHVKAHRNEYLAAAAGVVAVGLAAKLVGHLTAGPRDPSSDSFGAGRDDGNGLTMDEIEFADPRDSRFTAYLNKCRKSKKAVFLDVIQELQDFVALRDALPSSTSSATGVSTSTSDGDNTDVDMDSQRYAGLTRCIEFKALQADELLTQFIVMLDGLPVGDRADLKARRKDIVKEAVARAALFAPYLKMKPVVEVEEEESKVGGEVREEEAPAREEEGEEAAAAAEKETSAANGGSYGEDAGESEEEAAAATAST